MSPIFVLLLAAIVSVTADTTAIREVNKSPDGSSAPVLIPHFDPRNQIDITGEIGITVRVTCAVINQGEETVSFLRVPDQELLSVNDTVVTADRRIKVHLDSDHNVWILEIENSTISDAGDYECLLTVGPTSKFSKVFKLEMTDRKSHLRRRNDFKCGKNYTFGELFKKPMECDPLGAYPCCSSTGSCGYTESQCYCEDCIDYFNYEQYLADKRRVFYRENQPFIRGVLNHRVQLPCHVWTSKSDSVLTVHWKRKDDIDGEGELFSTDHRLETNDTRFSIRQSLNSRVLIINRTRQEDEGFYQCVVVDDSQRRFTKTFHLEIIEDSDTRLWRSDYRCSETDMLSGNLSDTRAQCDPLGAYPCCSYHGRCGFLSLHCNYSDSIDYALVHDLNNEINKVECPEEYYSHAGMCLAISNNAMNWTQAKEYCQGMGAQLVTFQSHEQLKNVLRIFVDQEETGVRQTWVGLYTKGHPQPGGMKWRWVTGERQAKDSVVMAQFGVAAPNRCGYLQSLALSDNGDCTETKFALCQKNPLA